MISPDNNGLYHPASEQDVIDLINHAAQNNLQVRVRGAAQSITASVYTDGYAPGVPGNNINMELDQIRSVNFDTANMQVTVGGGCNLGWDPFDPSQTSKQDNTNNLLYQLNQKGWALQNIPDAVHQTVAGFISTGSQGGSMMHSFDDCVVAIRLVDGTGTVKTFTKSSDLSDSFYAVGVSMGLLGVITSVTFQCVPSFNIIGIQNTTPVNNSPYDFFGNGSNGRPSLQSYLSNTEFTRMLWWPYRTVQRVITWQAHTMQASDYNNQTGTPSDFHPKPYKPVFPKIFGSALPAQSTAASGYKLIGTYPKWLNDIFGNSKDKDIIEAAVNALSPFLYPKLLDMFFACDSDKNPPQKFWDNWSGSLPMDTVEFSNNLFNMCYTEVWVNMNDAGKLVNTFQNYYQSEGFKATWVYCVEILAAKKSNFWMSPGYMQDSVRISIMWWLDNTEQPMTYYQQFWDLLKQNNIPFRLHWGKYLPPAGSNEGASYLASQYPKWNDFMNLRKQMDPKNIFLTAYWKTQLGIS
jgi:hypothetical protein